jgi:leader peptidase (prepilin peptidase)/N-methyltransferase
VSGDGAAAIRLVVRLGVAGLAVGSFLTVVIHRVPAGDSVIHPRSSCPSCHVPVRPRDSIPVLSWLLLRGQCRDCSAPISVRYPLAEVTTAILWVALGAWLLGTGQSLALLPVLLVLASAGVALTVIDLDHYRLPNAIVLPLYPVTVLGLAFAGLVTGAWPILPALGGAAVWLVVVGIPWLVSGGRGMGFGDVKLAPVLGALLGWFAFSSAIVGLFAAFALGAITGIALMLARRAGRRTALPFGPFLLVGALIGLLIGPAVTAGYLGLLAGS